MSSEAINTDVTELAEVRRLAEEVQRTRQPRVLRCNGRAIATIAPAGPEREARPGRRRRRTEAPDNSGLLSLVGIARSTDGVTDVSSNKHKYLAEAYYAESHPPASE